ncbi:MAG: hypothetical protein WAS07_08920 [Micropruina sp.]
MRVATTPSAVAEVSLLVQDSTLDVHGVGQFETKRLSLPDANRDRFLDGPATRRLAVVDFDPQTGLPLPPPAVLEPFKHSLRDGGRYPGGQPDSARTIAVNAFGTAFLTIAMFEGAGALGRQVQWAFEGEQLLIVPRAGQWRNAFYDRATRSLQFFYFDGPDGNRVYTALSRDIVAHECGHALLDAVVPSLHDSLSAESIAIHESVADMVAVLMALESKGLRTAVLAQAENSLDGPNAFNAIAEQFGLTAPTPAAGQPKRALRDLATTATLRDVPQNNPHQLSTVLSAAFYDTIAALFWDWKADLTATKGHSRSAAAIANEALGITQTQFRCLLLRGIDYLPPGELTFADVGRAMIAADRATGGPSYEPIRELGRRAVAQRLVDRRILGSLKEAESPVPAELSVDRSRMEELIASDWAAYNYVETHRARLGIPPDTQFTVLPRLDATKKVHQARSDAPGAEFQRELILKVAWDEVETNGVREIGAKKRRLAVGATVVLDFRDGRALALQKGGARGQRRQRDTMLKHLIATGQLETEEGGTGPLLRVIGDTMEVSNTHSMLHLTDEWP